MEKALKELILALKSIGDALMGNKNKNGEESEGNNGYTWYDFIKENCVDPVTPYLEQSNFSDKRNPVPVGIYDVDNDRVLFFKDVNINENIIEKYNISSNGSVCYEEPPRLFQTTQSSQNYWGSLSKIGGYAVYGKNIEFTYAGSGYEIDTLEYNGKTYYYSYFMSD